MELRGRFATIATAALCLLPPFGELAHANSVPKATATPSPSLLRPAFDLLDEAAEQRREVGRAAWIERMHRAAPGVDWQRIERANATENRLRREVSSADAASAWTEVGAVNQTGRTHVAMLHPVTGQLYVGTDLGGLWRGSLTGGSWSPLSDNVGCGVHGMTIAPGTPEVICTISDDGRIYRTTDGGATWSIPTGMPDRVTAGIRIMREPGTRRVYLLIEGWRWLGSTWDHSYQLMRSDDGGQSFALVHEEPLTARPDIWIDRGASGKPLYLMVGNTLERSTDGGVTFSTVGTTPATGDRAVLAGSEAGAPVLYAALHVGTVWKLYRSNDAGATWSYRSDLTDFLETLCASASNPQLVFAGGINAGRSTDGGVTFTLVNVWSEYYANPTHKLHADLHGIEAVNVSSSEAMLFDTDGGTYVSYDGGVTVTNVTQTGLCNGQYYSILTSRWNPHRIAAGSQDQGYQLSATSGAPPLGFTQVISGDYGHLTSATHDHNLLWSVYPGFLLLQVAENSTALEYPSFPPSGTHDWLPNIVADPAVQGRLYFCADHAWRIDRVAPNSYTYTRLPQDFSGGVGEVLTAIAISPANYSYFYAVTNAGHLWWSHDGGATWTQSASAGPSAHFFYGTKLLPSPTSAGTCFVGGSGYSGPAVYRTTDGGVTWTSYGTGLPPTLVYGLAFNNSIERKLFAATEAGPFRYDASTGTWINLLSSSCCAPLTTYWDVEALPGEGVMRFATFGRGIWDYATGSSVEVPDAATTAAPPMLELGPNPAQRATSMAYSLRAPGNVRIEVFDVTGHRVAIPVDGVEAAGAHAAVFELGTSNGRRLESGIYLVRIVSAEGANVRKLVIGR